MIASKMKVNFALYFILFIVNSSSYSPKIKLLLIFTFTSYHNKSIDLAFWYR